MCVSRTRALVSVRRAQGWWRAHISSKLSRSDAKEAASRDDAVASGSGATFEWRPVAHVYGALHNEDERPWPMWKCSTRLLPSGSSCCIRSLRICARHDRRENAHESQALGEVHERERSVQASEGTCFAHGIRRERMYTSDARAARPRGGLWRLRTREHTRSHPVSAQVFVAVYGDYATRKTAEVWDESGLTETARGRALTKG